MNGTDFVDAIAVAVTACDERGVITHMNPAARAVFARYEGVGVGSDLLACHPEPAATKLAELLAAPRLNAYTIEKAGRRKLVYQVPVYEDGQFRGIVELSLPLPEELPHFVRS